MLPQSDSDTTSLDYYYCPKCKGAPRIELTDNERVKITCKCSEIKSSIKDDDSSPKSMEELSKYESYEISINRYLQEIKQNKGNPLCWNVQSHEAKKGETFCTECQKWFCDLCLLNHNKLCNHLTFFSSGMKLNSLCENSECKFKQRTTSVYYCMTCNLHLCADCSNHGFFHEKLKLDQIFDQEKHLFINKSFQDYYKSIESYYLNYSNYLSKLKT